MDTAAKVASTLTFTLPPSPIPSSGQIEHLVLSGGSVYAYTMYAVLRELFSKEYLDFSKIKSIYATSCGAIVSVLIGLKHRWEDMDKYILERPMDAIYRINVYKLFQLHKTTGMFSKSVFEIFFSNVFLAKDLCMDMTLEDFYQYNGLEIHMFTTRVNELESIDISYKTHPHWTVLEAVYASSAVPFIFEPLLKEGNIYCDGFIFSGYPLQPFFQNNPEVDAERVLGIQSKHVESTFYEPGKTPVINLSDYINLFFQYLYKYYLLKTKDEYQKMKEIVIERKIVHLYDFNKALSPENRQKLFQYGIDLANQFMETTT